MANRIGLALSGGGSKGAFTVGALRVLRQKLTDTTFPVISGTSTGALIGTLLAVNEFTNLVDVYSTVKTENIVNPNHALVASLLGPEAVLFAAAILGGRSIYDTAALKATIEANVSMQKVKDRSSKTLLIYNTVDLQTGDVTTFSNKDHSAATLLKALLASSNQPVLMDPIEIVAGGTTDQYVDGGVREFLPLGAVFESGVDLELIIGISTAPLKSRPHKGRYDKIVDILARTIDLLDTEVGANDYYGAQLFNAIIQMIDNAKAEGVSEAKLLRAIPSEVRSKLKDKRPVPVMLIAPKDHLELDSLDFDPPRMRELISLGADTAKATLQGVM
jgi:NTE family protein